MVIEQTKISQRQAVYFILTTGFGTIIWLHSAVADLSGREAWLAETTGVFALVPLALWTLYLGRLAPGKTILEILETVAGKVIGKVVAGVYFLISVTVAALMLRSIGGLLNVFVLPDTPIWFTMLMILLLATIIADSGIEVQGRLGEVLIIILLTIFFGGMGAAIFTNFKFAYIIPFFERGIGEFARGTYLTAGSVAEAVLFLLIMVAALPRPKDSYWAIAKAFIWVGLILGGAILTFIGTITAQEAARISFGGVNVALNVQIGKFLQGTEVFVQIAYVLLVIINVAAHTYGSWIATAGIFNNWRPRLLLTWTAIFIAVIAVRIGSFNEAYYFSILLARYVTLPFVVLVLVLTSTAVLIRGGKVAGKRR